MQITVKLGGPLRKLVSGHEGGELELRLPAEASAFAALEELGLGLDQVRVIMLNGRPLKQDQPLNPGDRLALFPAECGAITEIPILFSHRPPRPDRTRRFPRLARQAPSNIPR